MWLAGALFSWLIATAPAEQGRYLVYTSGGGVFKFIIGFGVPVPVPMSLIFAHNFQFQYQALTNASELDYLVQHGILRSLSFTRHHLYTHLHSFFIRNGGKGDCFLKFICEMNETPIHNSGLIGELLQTIFTPDETSNNSWIAVSGGCSQYDCPYGEGLLDYISFLV